MAGLPPYQQAISWIIYLHMRVNAFNAKIQGLPGFTQLSILPTDIKYIVISQLP